MFTELRNGVHDIWPAVEKLVRAEGPQTLNDVFKRLPSYYTNLTPGDRHKSLSRAWGFKKARGDLMWHTAVRNLSRNQNFDPKYDSYPPIPGCALEYKSGRFSIREDLARSAATSPKQLEIFPRNSR